MTRGCEHSRGKSGTTWPVGAPGGGARGHTAGVGPSSCPPATTRSARTMTGEPNIRVSPSARAVPSAARTNTRPSRAGAVPSAGRTGGTRSSPENPLDRSMLRFHRGRTSRRVGWYPAPPSASSRRGAWKGCSHCGARDSPPPPGVLLRGRARPPVGANRCYGHQPATDHGIEGAVRVRQVMQVGHVEAAPPGGAPVC
jgi:hypothetical protein